MPLFVRDLCEAVANRAHSCALSDPPKQHSSASLCVMCDVSNEVLFFFVFSCWMLRLVSAHLVQLAFLCLFPVVLRDLLDQHLILIELSSFTRQVTDLPDIFSLGFICDFVTAA